MFSSSGSLELSPRGGKHGMKSRRHRLQQLLLRLLRRLRSTRQEWTRLTAALKKKLQSLNRRAQRGRGSVVVDRPRARLHSQRSEGGPRKKLILLLQRQVLLLLRHRHVLLVTRPLRQRTPSLQRLQLSIGDLSLARQS
mmetsp:Transcript_42908/g.122364  ORF Transcript_42908/g.122364 Transcript_42908/m.122364 type:complete len:139 (+) Transcript_42908:969-1385(+)